jgi:hypothetical protein
MLFETHVMYFDFATKNALRKRETRAINIPTNSEVFSDTSVLYSFNIPIEKSMIAARVTFDESKRFAKKYKIVDCNNHTIAITSGCDANIIATESENSESAIHQNAYNPFTCPSQRDGLLKSLDNL